MGEGLEMTKNDIEKVVASCHHKFISKKHSQVDRMKQRRTVRRMRAFHMRFFNYRPKFFL